MGNYVYGDSQAAGGFPYAQSTTKIIAKGPVFDLYEGYQIPDQNEKVSLLFCPKANPPNIKNKLASNGISRMMKLHHTGVVKYLATTEDQAGFTIATELLAPLSSMMAELSYEEIFLGLHQICLTLNFLHGTGKIAHCNLSTATIFLTSTETTDWKLGGFEFAGGLDAASLQVLQDALTLQTPDSIPPEYNMDKDKSTYASRFSGTPQDVLLSSRDAWALGNLFSEFLNNFPESEHDSVNQIIELLKAQPHKRLSMKQLLGHPFFATNKLAQFDEFLREILVKQPQEKEAFFKNLYSNVKDLPSETIVRAILPRILRYQIMTDPDVQHFLPHFFVPNTHEGGLLDPELYEKHIVSFITWGISQSNRHLRVSIMKPLQHFLPHLEADQRKNVFQQILHGLNDTDEEHIEETMNSLLIYYQHAAGSTSIMSILPGVVTVASSHTQSKLRSSATKFISQLLALAPPAEAVPAQVVEQIMVIFQVGMNGQERGMVEASLHLASSLGKHLDGKQAVRVLQSICPLLISSNMDTRQEVKKAIEGLAAEIVTKPVEEPPKPVPGPQPITATQQQNTHSPQTTRPAPAPAAKKPVEAYAASKPAPAAKSHLEKSTVPVVPQQNNSGADEWDQSLEEEKQQIEAIKQQMKQQAPAAIPPPKKQAPPKVKKEAPPEPPKPKASDFFDEDMASVPEYTKPQTVAFQSFIPKEKVAVTSNRLMFNSPSKPAEPAGDAWGDDGDAWGDDDEHKEKKAGGGWDDDDGFGDDDDEPKKPAPQPTKQTAPAPAAKQTPPPKSPAPAPVEKLDSFNFNDSDDETPKPKTAKPTATEKVESFNFGSDDEEEPKPKQASKPASKPATTPAAEKVDSFDFGSDDEKPASKPVSKPATPVAEKVDSFDFGSDDETPASKPASKPATPAATPKPEAPKPEKVDSFDFGSDDEKPSSKPASKPATPAAEKVDSFDFGSDDEKPSKPASKPEPPKAEKVESFDFESDDEKPASKPAPAAEKVDNFDFGSDDEKPQKQTAPPQKPQTVEKLDSFNFDD